MPLKQLPAAAVLMLALSALPARAETVTVTIEGLVFSPAAISAKVGDTIEWVNKDALAHTATVKGGWEVMIPPKKTASMVLKEAGQVNYYCRFHPNMKGRISVAAP